MAHLADIQMRLRDTHTALSRAESSLKSHPESSESILLTVHSLQKRQRVLEEEFLETANAQGEDVCTYRLFSDHESPPVMGISKALENFQTLFSLVYDALKSGPKKRATIGKQILQDTSLNFSYTFSGSVGVVLTIPNERLLIGETRLDEAMNTVISMAKVTEAQQLVEFTRRVGISPIRAIYDWAKDNVNYGLGADIEWRRQEQVRANLLIQEPELRHLRDVIDEMSEETEEEMEIVGELVGADVKQHTFHLRVEGGGEIRGRFTDAISEDHTVELPKRYIARIRKMTKIIYATEEEQVTYLLLSLADVV